MGLLISFPDVSKLIKKMEYPKLVFCEEETRVSPVEYKAKEIYLGVKSG